ncbi:hypothetical protein E4198_17325 [Streptomyces sp. RKND-216]|uniref:hypothetical protein n=1 Tax=Streptomyces sp. RKND-216 TaxID=2562581 RepID=UPI00109DFAB2|nr:hypothetical protein [Streptomyces sp. RKND-216]THA26218.1 hypothetical protein E4198_17325 [Streptomyces sp. RKND-216]
MAVVYTEERLADAVAESTTLREVAVRLGARPAPGTHQLGLDTGHFTRRPAKAARPAVARRTPRRLSGSSRSEQPG